MVGGSGIIVSDADTEGPAPTLPGPNQASVPEGLISAVVNLVNTGPVLLGAYTIAELTAVDAIVDFLEARPSDEVLAEAIRSLAARQLIVAGPLLGTRCRYGETWALRWRSSSGPGWFWMPVRPERVPVSRGESCCSRSPSGSCLMVRIDTFGVHQIGLYKFDEALRLLTAWLPRGPQADSNLSVDADGVLASSERSALVTVTHYTTQGSAEIAGASTDLVLARHNGRVHVFSRDPLNRAKLVPSRRDGKDVHDLLADLLT